MGLEKLNALYGTKFEQMAIRDHADHPHHAGQIQADCIIDLNNPTCGDVIRLSVKFDGAETGSSNQEKITDIAFSGHGCTISTASASMMTEVVMGKTKEEALELADLFSQMVMGQAIPDKEILGDAQFLAGVSKFPQRVKCATLAWNALKKAIDQDKPEVRTSLNGPVHDEN